ncbi:MAG: AI-2E family transporter [Bacteroidota bacterium]
MNIKNIAYSFVTFISVVVILIYAQSLILPFILGVLLWLMMRMLKSALEKIPLVRRGFPSWLKNLLAGGLIFLLINVLVNILSTNINSLRETLPSYEPNVDLIINKINQLFNVNLMNVVQEHSGDLNFGELLGGIFNSLSGLISNTFMIILYALFVLLEESNFKPKMRVIFPEERHYNRLMGIFAKIERSVSKYVKLKTIVSLITGVLSYIALAIIGVDSPVFWAFLIFILNFIPTIGSLIATLFPATFSLLQFGEFWPFLMVLLFVGLTQVLVGNVLEPRLMGSSMNISPLVTIMALSFWGFIWGITGMILSVPITVMMIIVCAQFDQTRRLAALLSENGRV